jgi:SAM-dependent methyltransferase
VARAPRARADRALVEGSRAHYDDASYYSHAYRDRVDDVAYYVALAADHGGPVIEYGIGNGRLAIPMARAGVRVAGVDHAPAMLDDLAARLLCEPPAVRARVRAQLGDMREARFPRRAPLVLCAFNTFLHLYTRDDIERFLAGVRRHMAPGGRFLLDVSIPNAEDLARDPTRAYRTPRFRHPRTGQLVRYAERFDYDPARQVLFVTMEFEPVDGTRPWRVLLAHRQFYPQELEALLSYNGFVVDDIRGSFDGEPLDRHSDVAVVSCRVA